MALWVGSNIIKLFSFTYIAASRTAHVHYFFLCIYTGIFHICITFLNMLVVTFDFFSHLENVGECCKAQWVGVHQRIALYGSYYYY